MSRSRYPAITEADILKLREYCLKWEAEGNSPRGGVGAFQKNVDLRRNIIVYVNRAGHWHLRRDWRQTFNKMYPNHAVDPVSTLKPKKEYKQRWELESLVQRLRHNYDPTIAWVKRDKGQWLLVHRSGTEPWHTEIGRNINEAYDWLDELYEAFSHSCPQCGCDFRLSKRVKDDAGTFHCPECGDTGERR